jgi:hypothetical protein
MTITLVMNKSIEHWRMFYSQKAFHPSNPDNLKTGENDGKKE